MKPTTNFRDAHFDVHISQQGRDKAKLEEAQRQHREQGIVETYVRVLMLQHDMRPNKEI